MLQVLFGILSHLKRLYQMYKIDATPTQDDSQEFADDQMIAYFIKDDSFKQFIMYITLGGGVACLIATLLWLRFYPLFETAGICFLLISFVTRLIISRGLVVPTDAEYDRYVQRKAQERLRSALSKINQEHHFYNLSSKGFLSIQGFVIRGTINAKNYRPKDIYCKIGKDKKQRYSINVFRYFLPIRHQLLVVVIDINTVNQKDRREQIHEYFLDDVVGVTTVDEYEQVGDEEEGIHDYLTTNFTLRISDGKPISVTILSRPLDHDSELTTYQLPSSELVDDTISELRMWLREHKHQVPSS